MARPREHLRPMQAYSKIIRASVEHVDLLLPLFESYRAFYGMSSEGDTARAFLHDRLEREESVVLVSLGDSGEATGFVQLYPSFSSVRLCRHWILNDLFVTVEARRTGVARSLISAAVTWVSRSEPASLELATEKTNLPARQLYESMGWRPDGRFDRFFYGC